MTQLVCEEFGRLGLPAPRIKPGLDEHSAWISNCVEKAHPTGTTRMSNHPKQGVVDANCQVHGVESPRRV
jgi:choline dehydrogenase-like flavoprotein